MILSTIQDILTTIFTEKKVLQKKDILLQLSDVQNGIVTVLAPYVTELSEKIEVITNDSVNKLFKNRLATLGFQGDNAKELLDDVSKTLEEAHEIISKLSVILSYHPDEVFTNRKIEPKIAYIITATNSLTSFSMYVPDAILSVMKSIFISDTLPKIIHDQAEDMRFEFKQSVMFIKDLYNDLNKLETKLNKIDDRPMDELSRDTLENRTDFLQMKLPTTNFVGNPIFHIRLALLERDHKNYMLAKNKMQYLNRVLDKLILKNEGKQNSNIDKTIANIRKAIVVTTKEINSYDKG